MENGGCEFCCGDCSWSLGLVVNSVVVIVLGVWG